MHLFRAAVCAASILALSAPLAAQDTTGRDGFEARAWLLYGELPDALAHQLGPGDWSATLDLTGYGLRFEDMDFRALDESSDQAIIDSDDRATTFGTRLRGRIHYKPIARLSLEAGFVVDSIWEQLDGGSRTGLLGLAAVDRAAVAWRMVDHDGTSLTLRAGRQRFTIGGAPRDHLMDDTVEGLVLAFETEAGIGFRALADLLTAPQIQEQGLLGISDDPFINQIDPFFGFDGDNFTLRSGVVLETDPARLPLAGLTLRAFAFYADIGGGSILGTGADRGFGGTLNNVSDKDWSTLFGGRISWSAADDGWKVDAWLESSISVGADKKEVTAVNADTDGLGLGAGASVDLAFDGSGLTFIVEGYHFDGPRFGSDGLLRSTGHMGMQGERVGGQVLRQLMGWRPGAHVDPENMVLTPLNKVRTSGTRFVHTGIGARFGGVHLRGHHWWLVDTGRSELDQARVDMIDPPFGFSREEFRALSRLGKSLGHEINVDIEWLWSRSVSLYGAGGCFLPGAFYASEIGRVAGSAQGSPDPQTTTVVEGGIRAFF